MGFEILILTFLLLNIVYRLNIRMLTQTKPNQPEFYLSKSDECLMI
jgi:hypothetical protein